MVEIDGKSFEWKDGITITKLLGQAEIVPRLGLVVIDGKFVEKNSWDSYEVKDGAVINTRPMLPGG
jgi:thiamine biosynthesis protein ThiS